MSFRQIPDRVREESSVFNRFWTPAFAGVTHLGTFYEFINIDIWNFPIPHCAKVITLKIAFLLVIIPKNIKRQVEVLDK